MGQVSDLKTLDSLWVGYTLTPERMEVRIEINGNQDKVCDSPWDNDSMILADHQLGGVVKLVKTLQKENVSKDEIIAKLRECVELGALIRHPEDKAFSVSISTQVYEKCCETLKELEGGE